jgi:hypothetical protein
MQLSLDRPALQPLLQVTWLQNLSPVVTWMPCNQS